MRCPSADRRRNGALPVIKPRAVRPGDRIAVVSPASPFARDELERGVAELRRLGYEPVYEESIFDTALFTSGPAEARAAAFMRAWSDPEVAALIAVRGGYGSVQLLPVFDSWAPQRLPEALHRIQRQHVAAVVAHMPMRCDGASRSDAGTAAGSRRRGIRLALVPHVDAGRRRGAAAEPDGCRPLCDAVRRPAAIRRHHHPARRIVSGRRSRSIRPTGASLFLEDVNERPYRIHRMLTQLRQSGILARARALAIWRDARLWRRETASGVHDVIRSFAADFAGPVLMGFPSGHTTGPCWTLPLGVRVRVLHEPRVCSRRGVTGFLMRIHFIGICGTAMATVAALLKQPGHDVTGSDQNVYPPMSDFLRRRADPDPDPVLDGSHPRRYRSGRGRQRNLPRQSGARDGPGAKGPVLLAARGRSEITFSGTRGRSSLPARTVRRPRRR